MSLAFLHTNKAFEYILIIGLVGTVAGWYGSFDDLDVHDVYNYPRGHFESLLYIMKQHLHCFFESTKKNLLDRDWIIGHPM
jgi:hypothetical protein